MTDFHACRPRESYLIILVLYILLVIVLGAAIIC